LTTLAAAPWSLELDESIWAEVVAMNDYGDSQPSPAGNGGVTKLVPDAPVNLLNDGVVTSDLSIRFTWETGALDGGVPVLDYLIYYD
jgi:hypothetical protein